MENYFQAKAKLFEQMAQDTRARRKPVAVINLDAAYGRRLAEMFSGRMAVKTYGSALGADLDVYKRQPSLYAEVSRRENANISDINQSYGIL